ncbi:MAG: hypothetical protein KKE86_13505 [Planctomycetes bacterium]|nr:hypothetical protein [Planctomycetota bacterium]MBU4400336.1 hypothetical protein [Planctomycetota bacterium]MCG2685096.1 hypothetical protein [Planctomycetales bacterium]
MDITLSPEQQRVLDQSAGHLIHVTDPRTRASYLLIPAEQYEGIREALEEERVQKVVHSVGMKNAVSRAGEDP